MTSTFVVAGDLVDVRGGELVELGFLVAGDSTSAGQRGVEGESGRPHWEVANYLISPSVSNEGIYLRLFTNHAWKCGFSKQTARYVQLGCAGVRTHGRREPPGMLRRGPLLAARLPPEMP